MSKDLASSRSLFCEKFNNNRETENYLCKDLFWGSLLMSLLCSRMLFALVSYHKKIFNRLGASFKLLSTDHKHKNSVEVRGHNLNFLLFYPLNLDFISLFGICRTYFETTLLLYSNNINFSTCF